MSTTIELLFLRSSYSEMVAHITGLEHQDTKDPTSQWPNYTAPGVRDMASVSPPCMTSLRLACIRKVGTVILENKPQNSSTEQGRGGCSQSQGVCCPCYGKEEESNMQGRSH